MDSSKELEYLKQREKNSLLKELKNDLDSYDIWISTGSSSGSLPGFAKEKGLVPAGWMISGQSKAVPYSGEFGKGMGVRGINKEAVSFSSPESRQSYSVEYATHHDFNTKGWTPEKGLDSKNWLEGELANLPEGGDRREWFKMALEVEQRRLEGWNSISSIEQQFISKPFPIIYGINYKHRQEFEPSIERFDRKDIGGGEVFIRGKIEASKLTLFCPRKNMDELQNYFTDKGVRITLLPLEVFSFLHDLWNWQLPHTSNLISMDYNERKKWEQKGWDFNKNFPTIHAYVDALKRWEAKSVTVAET